MRVLALNAGSSSLKFGLFDGDQAESIGRGGIDRIGKSDAVLEWNTVDQQINQSVGSESHPEAVRHILELVGPVDAIGCRVVHGGSEFQTATLVDSSVTGRIAKLAPLAPLHNSRDLDVLRTCREILPSTSLVAVFDTTFHQTLPDLAYRYAVPEEIEEGFGVRRYGFHGISYSAIVRMLQGCISQPPSRVIACHLGNGASVCAILDGKSVDTSMGMTPLEGLIMGTRSGDLDPGALIYLMRECELSYSDVDRILNKESGLLGLSGISSDVRELERLASAGEHAAEFALNAFALRVAKYVAAYTVSLGGLDSLVFAGGIGEHSHLMRKRICAYLKHFGLVLDERIMPSGQVTLVSQPESPRIFVIQTDEEQEIALQTLSVLKRMSP